MQPLVLKIVNKDGFGDYINGLEPDQELKESFANYGVLGDVDEPLFNAAITRIVGGGRLSQRPGKMFKSIRDQRLVPQLKNEMYLEKLPPGLSNMQ